MSEVWERLFQQRAWGRWPAEEVVRAVARMARPEMSVLEVGCGAGAQLWYLAHENHRPVGVDFAPSALRQAADRLREAQLRVPLIRGDARALPIRTRSFDVVLDVEAWSCLHEDDRRSAWREAARVLSPGGHLISIGFTSRTFGADSGTAAGPNTQVDLARGPLADLGTISFLDEIGAQDLAATAGLNLIETQHRSRTVGSGHELIEELVTVAERPT